MGILRVAGLLLLAEVLPQQIESKVLGEPRTFVVSKPAGYDTGGSGIPCTGDKWL
jgi:hypothetical protein